MKTLNCDNCGAEFNNEEDAEDYKHIEDTGECLGCFNII